MLDDDDGKTDAALEAELAALMGGGGPKRVGAKSKARQAVKPLFIDQLSDVCTVY